MHKNFGGKSGEKITVGRSRHRWNDNIRMDLRNLSGRLLNECTWLRIGTSGGPLLRR
jgi:hypothetical protein